MSSAIFSLRKVSSLSRLPFHILHIYICTNVSQISFNKWQATHGKTVVTRKGLIRSLLWIDYQIHTQRSDRCHILTSNRKRITKSKKKRNILLHSFETDRRHEANGVARLWRTVIILMATMYRAHTMSRRYKEPLHRCIGVELRISRGIWSHFRFLSRNYFELASEIQSTYAFVRDACLRTCIRFKYNSNCVIREGKRHDPRKIQFGVKCRFSYFSSQNFHIK